MIIKQNKGQTLLYAFLTLIVLVGCFFVAFFDLREVSHEPSILIDNAVIYWIFRLLGFACGVFFVCGEVYLVKQMFSKEPLMELCDEYFYDNSSAISLGKIPWEDMESAYIKGGFLNIKLKEPDYYFKRKSGFLRLLIKLNLKLGYGDICISPQRLKNYSEEFITEFKKRKDIDTL
jgi:hypothetical protein